MKKSLRFILPLILYSLSIFSIQAQDRPNIIFILTDDQPYGYMGVTGNTIVKTPNLDKLTNDGVLFTNAHITSAICTPSRVSILLGQYERKHGVNFNSGTSVSNEAWKESYPMQFKNAGYYTGWIGKNHAPVGKGGYQSGLMEKSFDFWYAGHGHLTFYPKKHHPIFKNAEFDTQVEIIDEGVTKFLDVNEQKFEGAVQFLEKRPRDKPFMLSINFNLPHSASTRTMEQKETDDEIYKSLYRDLDIPLPANYIAKADIKTPKLPSSIHRVEDRQVGYSFSDTPEGTKERYIRQMQAMTGIDRLVGNLRKNLKALKIEKNTIIVFTSDHGLYMGQQGLGGKALCYEITTHVPLVVYNPKLKKKSRGVKNDALVQSIDIAPTMLSFAGASIPKAMQGKDISKIVSGEKASVRNYVYTENLWSTQFGNPRCESVQNKEWKYIRYYKNNTFSANKKIQVAKDLGIKEKHMLYAVHDSDIAIYRDYIESSLQGEKPVYEELYNLKNDPSELHNLVSKEQHNSILEELRKEWKKQITNARGTDAPKVYRYTIDSQLESSDKVQLE
ncbi:arylsulfatase A-like enzyme [Maribacter vaceletii]|uniref:Arylsulfatase A-like enzyme n=1 Tax=Maribacter vaceletii TaxID=1206816 RepID=A0A495EEL7_9FLAO|nr:sulfatase-like hydrolase/transferase [Maribacter vaceletii]RKR14327.1 arylsulfatase A-like enzyme [Maribacter vaceletii]